jgi:hypothetical protein
MMARKTLGTKQSQTQRIGLPVTKPGKYTSDFADFKRNIDGYRRVEGLTVKEINQKVRNSGRDD